jgi:hypothetical protein
MTKSLREALEDSLAIQTIEEPETTEVEAADEVEEVEQIADDSQVEDIEENEGSIEVEAEQEENSEITNEVEEIAEQDEEEAVIDEPQEIIKPPQALTKDRKAAWADLPHEWQQEIDRLEKAQQKGIQKIAQSASFGEDMQKIIAPYEAIIRSKNAEPKQVIQNLLNANYVLSTGTPQEKANYLHAVAQQYGVPLNEIKEPAPIDPTLQHLTSQVSELQNMLKSQQTNASEAQLAQIQSEVETFANDPSHRYYEAAKEDMAVLLETGRATDLADAYEKACRLNGYDTKTDIPKVEPKKVSVGDKKKAAAIVKGSSGQSAKTLPTGSLHDTIAKQVYKSNSRI